MWRKSDVISGKGWSESTHEEKKQRTRTGEPDRGHLHDSDRDVRQTEDKDERERTTSINNLRECNIGNLSSDPWSVGGLQDVHIIDTLSKDK